jgi:hypothetical protein
MEGMKVQHSFARQVVPGKASLGKQGPERRAHARYSICAEVEYRITKRRQVVQTGTGLTVDLSSTGVLFEGRLPVPVGQRVELSIVWPARRIDSSRIEFHAEGLTVRTERNLTAVQITRYAFRPIAAAQAPEKLAYFTAG